MFLNEIEISDDASWSHKHWMTLVANYSRAPHFRAYRDFFEESYKRPWTSLNQLAWHFTRYLLDALELTPRVVFSSEIGVTAHKDELICDLCRWAGATTYLSGPFGREYLDVGRFRDAGISVEFHDYKHPAYRQTFRGFEAGMSVVDLLFNHGPESVSILTNGCEGRSRVLAETARGAPPAIESDFSVEGCQQTVLLRADASATVGTGHVMRMLALGQALKDAGARVTLATVETPDSLVTRCEDEGIRVVRLPGAYPDQRDAEATLALAHDCNADWVVVDGYDFDVAYHRRIRSAGHALLVVDDCAHLPGYDADILLNQNIAACEFPYCLPRHTLPLFGLPYVMLRREFRQARETLGPVREDARRVLVTLGGGDEHNVTGLVLDALASLTGSRLIVDVVVGAVCAHQAELERRIADYPHDVHLHVNAPDMARLMQAADVAVSGAGSTCWELATLGVPTCLMTLAENQRAIADKLGEVGAVVSLGWHHTVTVPGVATAVGELLGNPSLRYHLRAVCLTLVDGRGCERIIRLLSLWAIDRPTGARLRPAQLGDAQLLWRWANDPVVREGAFASASISWETHQQWLMGKLMSPNTQIWIAVDGDGKALGEIRFDRAGEVAEVDISVAVGCRHQGWGRVLLRKGEALVARRWPIKRILARIKVTNTASLRCFQGAGYKEVTSSIVNGAVAREFVKEL
jgi:UDP-2,4-diacetamido-2,4,6-trideoxy-beta-L-altropyranose hydrolase